MHFRTAIAAAAVALAAAASAASASSMTSHLGAHLSGMGEHGTVNLTIDNDAKKLCWSFDIPGVKGPTQATIHTVRGSHVLLELGMHYAASGCEKEAAMTIEHLAAKPGTYSVWVDTGAHMGEVRGTLSAGMARM